METLLSEIRYGVRSLLKHPGFTAIAVVTLALGISANTTIFSTVDGLLLHPFSFPNQDRLVVIFEQNRAVGLIRGSVSPGNFVEWREQNQGYEELVAIQQRSFDVADGSTFQRIPGYQVTSGFFQALGVSAARGRTLNGVHAVRCRSYRSNYVYWHRASAGSRCVCCLLHTWSQGNESRSISGTQI